LQAISEDAYELARELVLTCAAGDVLPEQLLDRLAAAVLDEPGTRLALAVQRGGLHKVDRALDLAAHVLKAWRASAVRQAGALQ
jgi:hypothetical protein